MTPPFELGPYLLDATRLTVQVAIVATLAITPFGVGLGYLLARKRFRFRALVQTLVAMPLVMPPVAIGVLLLLALGRRGPIGRLLHDTFGFDVVFTWWAAAIAAAVMSFPLLVRTAEAAFAEVPRRYEQVAQSLGASRWQVFFRVTLPLARRGVLYGLVLSFSRALGEFGATILVAGSIPGETTTLALGIYSLFDGGHDEAALVLMGVSSALAFVSILTAERWLRREPPRGRENR